MTEFSAILVGNESLLRHAAESLMSHGHKVLAVVTRNADLREWARGAGLRVEDQDAPLAADAPVADWLFSVANLSLLSPGMLARGRKGAINFHDGPLPRMAGLNAPLWAIMQGATDHTVTWHLIEGGIDEGDILAQRQFPIAADDNALTLNARCFARGAEAFADVIQMLENDAPIRRKQDLSQRGYLARDKRPEAASVLDFSWPVRRLLDLVRALDHGTYWNPLAEPKLLLDDGRLLRVESAEFVEGSGRPGQVLANDGDQVTVAVADGAIRLTLDMPSDGIGTALPVLDDAQRATFTRVAAEAAPHDIYWRRRLARLNAAVLPGVGEPGAGRERVAIGAVDVPLPHALAGIAAVLARFAGLTETDLALADTKAPTVPGLLADWVPLHVVAAPKSSLDALGRELAEQVAELDRRGGFMDDLLRRAPELRNAARPDLGISLRAETPEWGALWVCLGDGGAVLEYDPRRISSARAERVAGAICAALSLPESSALRDIPMLTATERAELLYNRNETRVDVASETMHDVIARALAADPDGIALVFENRQITRAELDRASNVLAAELVRLGVGPDKPVGIFAKRSPELVIGALAILKAGGAYVPLDPDYPADRIVIYVEDSGASIVLAQEGMADQLPPHGAQVVTIPATIPDEDPGMPRTGVGGEHLAYVIFTSGSTGRPKGVMIEHRNVTNFFVGMDEFIPHAPDDAWLAVTSLSFDISVLEIFWSLARGVKIVIAGEESRLAVSGGGHRGVPGGMEFSLFYWGNDDGPGPQKYKMLLDGARFADENGFSAVWTPERHFHAFGGPYPNPSVTGAAVAAVTRNIGVRAGSCVLPLHHPARVAEEWAVIDNLTAGRAGLAVASGWQPDDFVLRPENTPPGNKPAMIAAIEELRRLWRGEEVSYPRADGGSHAIVTQPRPVQKELSLWMTVAGNPDTWREAGRLGMNVLTHLLGQSIDEVGERIQSYHAALREAGHDPEDFTVTLMLHTCLAETRDQAREIAREPMKAYLRSAAALVKQYAWEFPAFRRPEGMSNPMAIDLGSLTEEELDGILEFAFLRYFDDSGLFGSLEDGIARIEQLRALGVGEIACLIDYGIAPAQVTASFPLLAQLRAIVNEGVEDDGDYSIAAQIRRHGVTHLQCTPSMARILVSDPLVAKEMSRLKCVMVGGEALPPTLLSELKALTDGRILNMYGPTETTIWSTVADLSGNADITLGRPIANTQIYVLDADGNPVPPDGQGELWIGGHGVTRGYWQRQDLTDAAFRPDPFVRPEQVAPAGARMYKTGDLVQWREDGLLNYIGRADHQIKLRGFRIELGEIEAALAALPGVRETVAIVREDSPGDRRLVAYVTGDAVPDEGRMREVLIGQLPGHMVPGRIIGLDRMPLTPNRKIDRKQLPSPAMVTRAAAPVALPVAPVAASWVAPPMAANAPAVSPRGGNLSQAVLEIWRETLAVPQIGPRDNFFAMGGHSLLAIQLHRTLRDRLGLARLGVTDIFRFPVLDAFQKHVAKLAPAGAAEEARPASPSVLMSSAPASSAPVAPPPAAPAPPAPVPSAAPAAAGTDAESAATAIERRRALRAQLRRNG